jgi:hypothetical protein
VPFRWHEQDARVKLIQKTIRPSKERKLFGQVNIGKVVVGEKSFPMKSVANVLSTGLLSRQLHNLSVRSANRDPDFGFTEEEEDPRPTLVFPEPSEVAAATVTDCLEVGVFDTSQLHTFQTVTDWNLFFHKSVNEFQPPIDLFVSNESDVLEFLAFLILTPDACGNNTESIAAWLMRGISPAGRRQIIIHCTANLASHVGLRLFVVYCVEYPDPDFVSAVFQLPTPELVPIYSAFSAEPWFTAELRLQFVQRFTSADPWPDLFTALTVAKVTLDEFPDLLTTAFRAIEDPLNRAAIPVDRFFAQITATLTMPSISRCCALTLTSLRSARKVKFDRPSHRRWLG